MDHEAARLVWAKSIRGAWLKLAEVDVRAVGAAGVYVIWHGGFPSRVVQVGYGDIATELQSCRDDPRIVEHAQHGPLFVTWAGVDLSYAAGIARHLEDKLHPLVEDCASTAPRIAANSPF